MRKFPVIFLFLLVLTSISAPCLRASFAEPSETTEKTIRVIAAEDLKTDGLNVFLMGRGYRDLWKTPIEVEFLDLALFAGGLTPLSKVEGFQAKNIMFKGKDGRDYIFRSIDHDPAASLPAGFVSTLSSGMIREQIASVLPAGSVCVSPFMAAAGVLHSDSRLIVLPDDPLLGEFSREFAGTLGTISEYPRAVSETNPGFHRAEEIIDSVEMWERMRTDPRDRIDSRALLRARLVDLLIGDWERSSHRWRWAKIPDEKRWKPVSGNRDQAFASHVGLLLVFARSFYPQLVAFTKKIPPMDRLTWAGRDIDRSILTDIDQAEWMAIAQGIQGSITDEVIMSAVRRLPEAYYRLAGDRLIDQLKKRRDQFLNAARRYFFYLAEKVDIFGTDKPEQAEIWRLARGEVLIRLSLKGQEEFPYYERRFRPSETKEIRIYLSGGNDRAVVNGPSSGRMKIRVVGGDGDDLFEDPREGRVKFYDSSGRTRLGRGTRTVVEKREYKTEAEGRREPWLLPRDWGSQLTPQQWLSLSPDTGAFLGAGIRFRKFGFRQLPYTFSHQLRMGYAAGVGRVKAVYEGDFRWGNTIFFNTILAETSGIDMLGFYGWGNESTAAKGDDYYRIHQSHYRLFTPLRCGLNKSLTVFIGPDIRYSRTASLGDEIIEELQPYGSGSFGQVGLRAGVILDTRSPENGMRAGFRVNAEASFHPPLWDVRSAYTSLKGDAVASLRIMTPVFLAVRMGGKMNFGDYPFHEAAFIGGPETVRGFRANRFAGDSCLYGNAELRLSLGKTVLFLPGEYGVFALTDFGRVFLDGEESQTWHKASGGGLFFSVVDMSTVFSLAVAKSEEHTSVYFKAGFSF